MSLGREHDLAGVRAEVGKAGSAGKPEPNKAGMSLKVKDMPKCDRPIKVLEEGEAGDFARRDAGETNPRGLKYAAATRYKNSRQNKPKPVISRAIYGLQEKSARFSANLNGNDPSRIPSLMCLDRHPSIRASENRRCFRSVAHARGSEPPSLDSGCRTGAVERRWMRWVSTTNSAP